MKIKSMYSNKKGASAAILYVILAILVVGMLGIGFMLASKPTQQTQLGGGNVGVIETPTGPIETSCGDNEPYIVPKITDAVNPGTTISNIDYAVSLNGGAAVNDSTFNAGTSKFNSGDKLRVLIAKSSYLNKAVDMTISKCGKNSLETGLAAASASNTITIFNSNGNVVTDNAAGGATNQTNKTSTIVMKIEVVAPPDKASGDLVVAIESNNDTEIKDFTLTGTGASKLGSVADADGKFLATPRFRIQESTGSTPITRWFELDGSTLVDNKAITYSLSIEPDSGKTIGASNEGTPVYVTFYAEEWYIDVDGSLKYGVEDADSTTKYEYTQDYDFRVGAGTN